MRLIKIYQTHEAQFDPRICVWKRLSSETLKFQNSPKIKHVWICQVSTLLGEKAQILIHLIERSNVYFVFFCKLSYPIVVDR